MAQDIDKSLLMPKRIAEGQELTAAYWGTPVMLFQNN